MIINSIRNTLELMNWWHGMYVYLIYLNLAYWWHSYESIKNLYYWNERFENILKLSWDNYRLYYNQL